ncbi:MAG TPA: hypothetical protein DER09_14010, partial [Prolixibacteraceae bacterium]|nr:hypothetical protein [Prolixibacteraceae bacterium]
MQKTSLLLTVFTFIFIQSVVAQNTDLKKQWFMYRGNYASGVLENANLPETWNAETGSNIAWNTKIPGT